MESASLRQIWMNQFMSTEGQWGFNQVTLHQQDGLRSHQSNDLLRWSGTFFYSVTATVIRKAHSLLWPTYTQAHRQVFIYIYDSSSHSSHTVKSSRPYIHFTILIARLFTWHFMFNVHAAHLTGPWECLSFPQLLLWTPVAPHLARNTGKQ